MCDCVYTIWIGEKRLLFAGACGSHVLPHATKLWTWVGWETWPVSCTCILIYCIVPPLGAYKSQLGGTYNLSLLFYIFNVSCDPIYSFFLLISSCLVFVVFCTTGTPHIRIREDVLIQVCTSCRSRQDGMSPTREPSGKELILQSDSEFTLL